MTARLAAGLVLAVGLALAAGGCKAHEGQKVVGYAGGKTNNWKKAPDSGRYALRTPGGANNVTYFVRKDERMGFRKGDTPDTVEAYAGDNAPVYLSKDSARNAYWKFVQKAEQ
jgi:hypothetical protein